MTYFEGIINHRTGTATAMALFMTRH